MDCTGFGLADILLFLNSWRYRRLGLIPKIFELKDGSTIFCWVPDRSKHGHKPNVMLIHGFGGDGTSGWSKQVSCLTKDYAVYIPDLLFFGKSYTLSEERSEIFQALCMLEVLKHEDVKEISAIGTSYGGFVTFFLAHLAPNIVKNVVIASSGICMDRSVSDKMLSKLNACDLHDVFMPKDKALLKKVINNLVYEQLKFIPDFILNDLQQKLNVNREEKVQLLNGLVIGKKGVPDLPSLTQDVLLIWGEGDKIFGLEEAYKLQRHLRGKAQLVIIPKTGHIPQLERAAEFNNHVVAFLKERW